MMKKLLLLIVFVMCGVTAIYAQGHHGKKHDEMMKEIQEFKMKYLAQEMELRDDQKERFFELYDEFDRKRMECMKSAWRCKRKLRENPQASEEDYKAASDAMNNAKERCADIDKEYDEKFAQFLSQKQIFKMKKAEDEFRKKMEDMRRKRGKR